jgi:galactokinase
LSSAASRSWLVNQLADDALGEPRLYCAPGRVNVIGEHTDYTGGLVMPTTTAAYTWVAASPRTDRSVTVRSLDLEDEHSFDLDDIQRSTKPKWFDYIKGVAVLLEQKGRRLAGASFVIDSEIPIGGGLSSSAALEVVFATAFLDLAGTTMPRTEIAQLCQRAEIEYAGVNCGVMDQIAIACCHRGSAMLLDCRSLKSKQVQLPDGIRFLLTDSGVKHKLSEGDYNQRTDECAEATRMLSNQFEGMKSLRDLSPDSLEDHRTRLGDRLYRRCRHVTSENKRVLEAYEALGSGDFARLGELVSASHGSLRDDFEVSCVEVDSLVEIADSCEGVLGSRMVGAGFGGCVLSVTRADKLEQTMLQICNEHEALTGRAPWMHVVTATDAAMRIREA